MNFPWETVALWVVCSYEQLAYASSVIKWKPVSIRKLLSVVVQNAVIALSLVITHYTSRTNFFSLLIKDLMHDVRGSHGILVYYGVRSKKVFIVWKLLVVMMVSLLIAIVYLLSSTQYLVINVRTYNDLWSYILWYEKKGECWEEW